MRGVSVSLMLILGCRFDLPEASVDVPDAASATPCDVTKPFGPPVPVDGVNENSFELWGWPSEDQLTIYFTRDLGGNANLYSATRAQPTGAFTGVALLGGVNTPNFESRPVLTADGLTLFMDAGGGADFNIHVATRASTAAIFSAHTPVAIINNTTSNEVNPWISEDGLIMYFASSRAGTYDIFSTSRASTSSLFSVPMAVGELNTTMADDGAPKDGLEIFFASSRDQGGTNPPNKIFRATRSMPSEGFGTPAFVAELSVSTSEDYPNWVSPDRCHLMFTSDRGGGSGGYDIWIATRSQ